MAIVQEAFDIPADIFTRILTGEYRRIGGVVRWAGGPKRGQIVKHLKPIEVKAAEQAQGVGVKMLKFAKNHKKGLIIISAAVGITAAGVGIYHKVKNSEPEFVTKFRSALKVYVNAIRNGDLNVKIINNLMVALEELKKHKNYDKISIQLSTEELDVLVNRIYDYTIKLAKNNCVEIIDEETGVSDSAIINLQKYLNTQKRIFETAV